MEEVRFIKVDALFGLLELAASKDQTVNVS